MKSGDIVTKNEYTQYAIWCNKNNAHIEKQGKKYIIVGNTSPAPTKEELLSALEAYLIKDYAENNIVDRVPDLDGKDNSGRQLHRVGARVRLRGKGENYVRC